MIFLLVNKTNIYGRIWLGQGLGSIPRALSKHFDYFKENIFGGDFCFAFHVYNVYRAQMYTNWILILEIKIKDLRLNTNR